MIYQVIKTISPSFPSAWDSPFWSAAPTLDISSFHPKSDPIHRPLTQAKVLYDSTNLYVHMRAYDRYVRAEHRTYQSFVCQDSCAEFFVEPVAGKGYFNFEINPLGTTLLFYVEDPARVGPTFAKYTPVPESLAKTVELHPDFTPPASPDSPVTWSLQYRIPLSLFEHFVGPLSPAPGQSWRANFFKCGDHTPHPHWASWSPIAEELNFHQPKFFGSLLFQ